MEAANLVLSAAQTLFAALQNPELKELCSMFGYKSELERLKDTVSSIKAVLQDAGAKEILSSQEQDLLNKLRIALYDADDLFDEFTIVAGQEKHRFLDEGGRRSDKVRILFSRFDKLLDAYKMSREVKRIRKTLDRIADDATMFSFKVDYQPIRRRREETCSYVYHQDIIGREDDVRKIVEMLLDPRVKGDSIYVLSIVGIGGLGKTTLAQLVFNDERVKKGFPLRLWACVADQDPQHLDVRFILVKILESAIGQNHDASGIEVVQRRLREQLQGRKYLLVLDDVWTENRSEWLKLVNFLMEGQGGSMIVVTTRSKLTAATAIGSNFIYELKGLSDENSWHLFEMVVGQEQANRDDLVEIGKAIVKKCANVPLAIRVVGALLYGQDKTKWRAFQQGRLTEIRKHDNDIIQILKLSYHHLSPSLKSCFSYCAIFPKDFVIEKEALISLWMAQGYIEPLDGDQSIEDAGEEYFSILLQRCFFQDVEKDEYGQIVSCKIHDLLHDIAQEVAGKEICVANSTMSSLDKNIRHVSQAPYNCTNKFFTESKVRTYFLINHVHDILARFPLGALLTNSMSLRALYLPGLSIRSLPEAIGELLHLRYLNLSWNFELEILHESITKLQNLQTLNLRNCEKLEALPRCFSKLVKLRLLDLTGCLSLTHMPSGMKRLTCLCRLSTFRVAENGRTSSLQKQVGGLEDLRALRNLRGYLKIYINKDCTYALETGTGGYLSNKEHLTDICIKWEDGEHNEKMVNDDEALLKDMQPHRNLRGLTLIQYSGTNMPRWAREDNLGNFLPYLIKFRLRHCNRLEEVPSLSKLRFLKTLKLGVLRNLEYVENKSCSSISSYGTAATASGGPNSRTGELESMFFPSLELLYLKELPKLKGWWRGWGSGVGDDQLVDNGSRKMQPCPLISFPRLSELHIWRCPNLISIPLCPTVKKLSLIKFNERLHLIIDVKKEGTCSSSSSRPSALLPSDSRKQRYPQFRIVATDNVGYLKSLEVAAIHCLTEMQISGDQEVESFSEVREVFHRCLSSLRSLEIKNCNKLQSLYGGGLEYLTALESLELDDLCNLTFTEEDEGNKAGMPWRSFGDSLRTLRFARLPKLVNLPKGMRHLTSLQYLYVDCALEALPEWIGCLSSLQSLEINCDKLELLPEAMRKLTSLCRLQLYLCPAVLMERCQKPYGEDWAKIQHINCIKLSNRFGCFTSFSQL